MTRLIDADALKNDLITFFPNKCLEGITTKTLFNQILTDIDNAPTVEPQRPKGEWKVYGRQGDIPITDYCSNCKYEMRWYRNKYKFCPNCGADMREEIEE